jgi:NAD(P)-dependent dehydrogenase (short-subunit alcohol dehydrogenase family)
VVLLDTKDQLLEGFDRSLLTGIEIVDGSVLDSASIESALGAAERNGPVRALVHCADKVARLRILERDGTPGPLDLFEQVVRVNLIGTFNVLRLAVAHMVLHDAIEGERGVAVLTSSISAYEGQIGQIGFAAAKAGIVGMTLAAARDLAGSAVRVCTIAPGLFATPMFGKLPEKAKASLETATVHPPRLGDLREFAELAAHIIQNPMLNGETIRLDGAVRMAPR